MARIKNADGVIIIKKVNFLNKKQVMRIFKLIR